MRNNYSIGPCTCEWHGEQLHNIWVCPKHGRMDHQPTREIRAAEDPGLEADMIEFQKNER